MRGELKCASWESGELCVMTSGEGSTPESCADSSALLQTVSQHNDNVGLCNYSSVCNKICLWCVYCVRSIERTR